MIAAVHKIPGKSSLNVRFVFHIYLVCPAHDHHDHHNFVFVFERICQMIKIRMFFREWEAIESVPKV